MRFSTFWRIERCLSFVGVVTAAALLGGCGRSDISERPPLVGDAVGTPMETQLSTIGALVSIPLEQATQTVNAVLPRNYEQPWTHGENLCVDLGVLGKHCIGTQYKYRVTRGDIAIEAVDSNVVKLRVDISIDGQGGFRGELPRLIDADAKNFDGRARFEILLRPGIGSDWCPTIEAHPSYHWISNPRVEIVSRVNVDVSGQVSGALNGKMPQIAQAVQGAINCAQFKSQLATVFGTKTFPVTIKPGSQLHLNVEPLDFAASALHVSTQTLRLAAQLTAKVELSGNPITAAPLPLPALKPIGVMNPPRIAVAVPVRTPFVLVQAEAQKLIGGKTFEGETPAGMVKATVSNVHFYPTTGGKVAAGIDFDAELPGKILDTKGSVFVVGTPITEGRTVIRMKDPTFTRILDNELWNVISTLFDSKIRAELDKSLRHDFVDDLEKAKQALIAKLADPAAIPNVKATATDVDIGLGRVGVNGEDLVAEALLGANVTLQPNLVGLAEQQ